MPAITKSDPSEVARAGYLPQHDGADQGRGRRQERQHQRGAGARQARHGELVADIGNDRGAQADADAGEDESGDPKARTAWAEPNR